MRGWVLLAAVLVAVHGAAMAQVAPNIPMPDFSAMRDPWENAPRATLIWRDCTIVQASKGTFRLMVGDSLLDFVLNNCARDFNASNSALAMLPSRILSQERVAELFSSIYAREIAIIQRWMKCIVVETSPEHDAQLDREIANAIFRHCTIHHDTLWLLLPVTGKDLITDIDGDAGDFMERNLRLRESEIAARARKKL